MPIQIPLVSQTLTGSTVARRLWGACPFRPFDAHASGFYQPMEYGMMFIYYGGLWLLTLY